MADVGDLSLYGLKTLTPSLSSDDFDVNSSASKKSLSKEEAVIKLKEMIKEKPEYIEVCSEEKFLLRFLHARKMNVEESYQLISNYYSYRIRNKQLFDNMSTEDPLIKQALYDGFPGVLTEKDRKGRSVLVFFCNNWDQANYPLEVIYRSLLLSLEKLLDDPHNQVNGFVIIVDWTDISLRQVTSLGPKTLKLMVEGLQDCFPARFKGIHFINQPWYIDPIIVVMKTFLKDKTKKKIYIHGNNLSRLHDHVCKDILPAELGGEGPPHSPTEWAHSMVQALS